MLMSALLGLVLACNPKKDEGFISTGKMVTKKDVSKYFFSKVRRVSLDTFTWKFNKLCPCNIMLVLYLNYLCNISLFFKAPFRLDQKLQGLVRSYIWTWWLKTLFCISKNELQFKKIIRKQNKKKPFSTLTLRTLYIWLSP